MRKYICQCEDSSGTPHNFPMTKVEYDQDGMCNRCADHVWEEITSKKKYTWYHPINKNNTPIAQR